MRSTEVFVCAFKALVFFLLWPMRNTEDSYRVSAPEVVTGTRGGSVTVPCQYNLKYRDADKYWCKGLVYEFCEIVIRSSWGQHHDRSSIVDDKESGVFTVTMTSLGESDKDKYWCVISRRGRNFFAGVRLRLSNAVTTPITTTEVNSLGTVEQHEVRWWSILRWILFISMLCCLALTHFAERRMKAMSKIQIQQELTIKT